MALRLYCARVFVEDWEGALAFYKETLRIPTSFEGPDMGWAELDTGESKVALERVSDDEGRAMVGRFTGLSLSVDDIQAEYEKLSSRGVEFLAPPEAQPWGGVLAHFRDPEGNVLTLLGSPSA